MDGGSTSASDADASKNKQEQDNLRNTYRSVISNLSTDDFSDADGPDIEFTGAFQYATADLNGDQTPELLVKAVGKYFSPVRAYSATGEGKAVSPDKVFYEGGSSAGGSRAGLHTASDHTGLLQDDWMAGTGMANSSLWTFKGTEITESGRTWDYRIDQVPSDLAALQSDIDWIDTSDSSALDNLSIGQANEDAASGSGPAPTMPAGEGTTGGNVGSAGSSGNLPQSATAAASQIGGTCGTVDGITVSAGDSTSCGFAMNVAQQALSSSWGPGRSADPSDPTAPTWSGSTTLAASSPETGQSYTLQCDMNSDGRGAHCEGGNGALVNLSGSLTHLLQ